MKEILTIPGLEEASYAYSHVVREGTTLYLTSQLSCDLKTGRIIIGTIEEQTQRALENVKYLLEQAHSSLANVLRVRVYMRDVAEFSRMESVYRAYFEHGNGPARVTVQAPSPLDDIKIEIEVTATVDDH